MRSETFAIPDTDGAVTPDELFNEVETRRQIANVSISDNRRSKFGQFLIPANIALWGSEFPIRPQFDEPIPVRIIVLKPLL